MTDVTANASAAPLVLTPKTTEKGQRKIMGYEGCALRAYRDIVGVWTIGFGNTNMDKTLGFVIKAGVTITFEDAIRLFRNALVRQYEPEVTKAMPNAKPNEYDGGSSFHYNTGAISRAGWVKALARGDMSAVYSGLLSWNRAGGRVVAGLTSRRKDEAQVIIHNNYGVITDPVMIGERGEILRTKAPTPGMLRVGSKGPEVTELQTNLKDLGYLAADPDGDFGDATEAALEHYQHDHPQLTADGVGGPATRAALQRDADMKRKVATTGGVGTVTTTAGTVVNHATGGHVSSYIFIALGVAFAVGLLLTAWRYRDEIARWANSISGRSKDDVAST